jgi:DNA gyrase subunit A
MTLIERIIELARGVEPDALSEPAVSLSHGELYDEALEAFGGWDIALAAALKQSLVWPASSKRVLPPRGAVETSPPAERSPHPDAMRGFFLLTSTGFILRVPAERLAASRVVGSPRDIDRWHESLGQPSRLADLGHVDSVLAFTTDGNAHGYDIRLVPNLSDGDGARRLGLSEEVSGWVDFMDRDALYEKELIVSVTQLGIIKVSHTSSYPGPVGMEGTRAFLVDGSDQALAVHAAAQSDRLLLASSDGYAIAFDLAGVRAVGRKAVGVRGMKLRGVAKVVGSLLANRWDQIAMVTAQGVGKRVPLSEFRPQSRAGMGLVATKLAGRDRLAAVAGCGDNADLVLWTLRGRALRIPAHVLPLMGRPARGLRVVDLADGDEVVGLSPMLPMDFE